VFEDTSRWLPEFENTVTSIGNRVYTNETAIPIPRDFDRLLEELEDISHHLVICGSPLGTGWAARLLSKIQSFSYSIIVDMYIRLLDRWGGSSADKMIHLLSSLSYTIYRWVSLISE
jgi:hypothetical protein